MKGRDNARIREQLRVLARPRRHGRLPGRFASEADAVSEAADVCTSGQEVYSTHARGRGILSISGRMGARGRGARRSGQSAYLSVLQAAGGGRLVASHGYGGPLHAPTT